ncbi:MAG: M16 family metallopeptidase [Pyrinomonadaceae bacterium]
MKRQIVALLFALLIGPAAVTAQVRFDRSQYSIPHKKFVLKNGLTLIVHEDKNVPIVAVNMWYHVGSRNEKRGRTGFAHLFEHFFFNGSENHPFGFREAMDDLGANNRNGTTNTDRTNFFEDVPVSALEKTLFLEADRMGFLGGYISQEMLTREKGVVQNEKRQGENNPYGRVFGEISEKMYPYSHPYSWSTIGSMEDLSNATLADIKEWYETYYGPNNAVISLAGDISAEKALELVTKYFGDIKPGPPLPRAKTWIPVLERDLRDSMEDRVPQHRIYRAWHAPGWSDPELQHLRVFADALSGSKSSRLDRKLVYEKELVTNVSAGVIERELGGMFNVVATVKRGVDPSVVEREIDAVISEALQSGLTSDEVQRTQNRILAGFLRGSESLGGFGGRSDILAGSETYGGSPEAYLDRLEIFARSTPEQIKTTANKWLKNRHYTMVVNPAPQLAAERRMIDRKNVPAIGGAPEVTFPAVQRAKLKNGLNVILLERHSTPIVNVALAVDAGSASEPAEKAGSASMALSLMDEGTKTRNAFQISDELDSIGANLSTGNGQDLSFVRLESTSAKLGAALPIMADVVLNPAFPADKFELEKQLRLAQIGQELATPNALAFRVMPQILYGPEHAYSKPSSGTPRSIGSLTRDDLIKWHSAWFRPASSTIIVTGDTTLAALIPMLEQAFGGWPSGTAPEKKIGAAKSSPAGRIYLIDKPNAPQSTIMAAHLSLPSGQPEDLAGEPLFRNFGGMSTSRLNRNLRLEKHWSYGTSGGMQNYRGERPFFVLAPVQTDKTKESMAEVLKEIRGVAGDRPVTGEEFESIMRNMTMRLPGRFETLSSLENAAVNLVNFGLADDYWSTYPAKIRKLSETDLAAAGKKFVRPNDLVWLIIGDLRKIESGVRELGYGEVIVLGPDGSPTSVAGR